MELKQIKGFISAHFVLNKISEFVIFRLFNFCTAKLYAVWDVVPI